MPEEIPVPPWRRPKKAPPRMPLTQDRIVVTALGILDAEGLDALSMRRLAQELKTGHASLYAHVGNRDELLDLVFDIVLTEVEVPEPEPGRWAEQVKEMCRSLRRMFLAHRDLARIAIDRVPLGPNGMVGMERTMNLLRSGACTTNSPPTGATCCRPSSRRRPWSSRPATPERNRAGSRPACSPTSSTAT